MTKINEIMTSRNVKTVLFASLIVAMILPFSGMNSAFGDKSEINEKELKAIFGDNYELAKKYHDKDQKVKEYEKKKTKSVSDKESKNNAKIKRALDLGKLNAHGYMTKTQLDTTLETGVPVWNTPVSERTKTVSTTSVVYNSETGITYACSCGNTKHIDFVGGYVYYTHWGLWKHTEFGSNDHISYSKTLGGSITVVLKDIPKQYTHLLII